MKPGARTTLYKLHVSDKTDADAAIEAAISVSKTVNVKPGRAEEVKVIKTEASTHAVRGTVPWAYHVVKLLLEGPTDAFKSNVRSDRIGRTEEWR